MGSLLSAVKLCSITMLVNEFRLRDSQKKGIKIMSTKEISISNVEEFSNEDSIDKAIELLQELKQAKHSPAFVLTTSSISDVVDQKATATIKGVAGGRGIDQLNSLTAYFRANHDALAVLNAYFENQ